MRDFGGSRALERLSMYSTGRLMAERRFEASLFRTMAELKKLQHVRKSEQTGSTKTQAAIPPLGKAATHRQTQGRDALATVCAKQSQSAGGEDELSAFEKREYALLLGAAPAPNKANDPQQRPEDAGQKAETSRRSEVTVCRY
jgi:hypothetical protein